MNFCSNRSPISRIAFIGNYLPRQCGIATFTTDLCEAIAIEHSDTTCIALPVNDIEGGYPYPSRVRFELVEKDIESYRRAADFLNINNVDLVSLQFEYGIFGGRAGSHILTLLRELRMPIVTTLHTILRDPDTQQRQVLQAVAGLSDRLIVMSERGREFLQTVYRVLPGKIDLIPHGIPDLPFVDPSFHKGLFGVEGKIVLLSFGLLRRTRVSRMSSPPCQPFWPSIRMSCTSSLAQLIPTSSGTTANPTGCLFNGWLKKNASKLT
jgi:glycosyltransferase involved in cell wall biosynthesis